MFILLFGDLYQDCFKSRKTLDVMNCRRFFYIPEADRPVTECRECMASTKDSQKKGNYSLQAVNNGQTNGSGDVITAMSTDMDRAILIL